MLLFTGAVRSRVDDFTGMLPVYNPEIIETSPADGETGVFLYRQVTIKTKKHLKNARVEIPGMPGRTYIYNNKIVFKPFKTFLPATEYQVTVFVETADHTSWQPYKSTFTTMQMQNKIWVEVDLNGLNTVTVYREKMPLRTMLASGGRPGHETPLGTFYTRDRGYSFWSARFGEGAYYWVRITGQYLFHSVPVDDRWQTKEEEHAKLGCPASHGCVRLSLPDAKWFFENVPRGSMVIIHN